eukprot:768759-Hanusia_phi.AAC.20
MNLLPPSEHILQSPVALCMLALAPEDMLRGRRWSERLEATSTGVYVEVLLRVSLDPHRDVV